MTTETNFTPGPWSVDRSVIRGDADHLGRTVAVASTLNVAWPYGRRATKEEPYNAHLIAAAPELFSLLKEARSTLEMWKDVAPAVSLCADIDKALAKARGES